MASTGSSRTLSPSGGSWSEAEVSTHSSSAPDFEDSSSDSSKGQVSGTTVSGTEFTSSADGVSADGVSADGVSSAGFVSLDEDRRVAGIIYLTLLQRE